MLTEGNVDLVDAESARVIAGAVRTGSLHEDLVRVIERERRHPHRGKKPVWIRQLVGRSSNDLAAATLYAIVHARLAVEDDLAEDSPYAIIAAETLGLALDVAPDRDLAPRVGLHLLALAALAGIIAPLETGQAVATRPRIILTPKAHERIRELSGGAACAAPSPVRDSPPRGAQVQPHRQMRQEARDPPPRVEEAADKIQGTPWRINKHMLRFMLDDLHGDTDSIALQEAKKLVDRAGPFYFPVDLDYRGRVTQRTIGLSFTSGSDTQRAVLQFAQGEVLDDQGMKWLAYHAAQMWGRESYVPFGDGTAWLKQHAAETVKSGRWREAKEPYQLRAALDAYERAARGEPCHVPVRLDGSCSAIQHLVLLTRDALTAPYVGLWGDTPDAAAKINNAWLEVPHPDFYSAIAERTKLTRQQVKAVLVPALYGAGVDKRAAALLDLRRESNPGARLSKRDSANAECIWDEAHRVAPVPFELLEALREVPGLPQLRYKPMVWTTPSGFTATMGYCRYKKRPKRVVISVPPTGEPLRVSKVMLTTSIDQRKQQQSFRSALIHSLDAAFLAEVVAGGPDCQWATAHDAFYVLPGHIPALLDSSVAALDALYFEDRLAALWAEWYPPAPGTRGPLPKEMRGGLRTIG